ncbi:MAG: PKD domain-containing protein [Chitinophagaceae bacterium]
MRKLYALLAGILLTLAATARTGSPDIANFTYVTDPSHNDVVFTNTSVLGNEPGTRKAFWSFGDGTGIMTPPLQGTNHHYASAGTYTVCLKIYRYYSNLNDSVLSAQICKTLTIETICGADFEKLPPVVNNPLLVYFKALPQHNNNRKPARICWTFGDGRDTCISYAENYTGQYAVSHRYNHPGQYEVCIKILYYGGCEARKCKVVQVGEPDRCSADFQKYLVTTPLLVYFKALPQHNNNRKPARVCWTFGDGHDTCINYPENYSGLYTVRHLYNHPGQYEVCVKIIYYGGCEARKCEVVQVGEPDRCSADFEKLPPVVNNPLLVYFKALPQHNNNRKPARICWTFGDGRDTCINYADNYTGQYAVSHRYNHPGQYEVCVKIIYYGGCEARKCEVVQVGEPDRCSADFEKLLSTNNPLLVYFKALPQHNNNRKPARICWTFGDGRDTCINYAENYTGLYAVSHRYDHRGLYEVCVKILYYGGCEARKCAPVQVGEPDHCNADFEKIQGSLNNPLQAYFRALPQHDNNRNPARICWTFGDGRDTCINYPEIYTGQYVVSHRYEHPGQYEVCVKILYYGGCEARKCNPVVIPPPVTCRVHLFELIPSITSLVRGFVALPNSSPSARVVRVCWYFGDGEDTCIIPDSRPSFFFIRHVYPAPGVYRACVKILYEGGCLAEDCKEVVIRPSSEICGGYMRDSLVAAKTFKFKGFSIHNPNDDAISYQWSFGDGSTASGQEVTHTYNNAGNYEVCLRIRTRLGCETRICNTIRVYGNHEPALRLTPNPVVNILHVDFLSTHTEQVNIKIVNSIGTVLRTYTRNVNAGPNSWTIDLTSLVPGVYTFVVQSPNQLASALFIKQ